MPGSESAIILNPRWRSIEEITASAPEGELLLDLGCGYYKPLGYIGLDNLVGEAAQIVNEANAPDILMDLNSHALPFPEGSIREVRSSHFLEHSNLDHIINEAFRVLRHRGRFAFTVPYANSAEGMYPGHHIFLTEKWFHENLNFQGKFSIDKEEFFPSAAWKSLPLPVRWLIPFSFARKFLYNACWQMTIEAVVRK
jgi:SAM-dependent methyltransferase